MIKKFIGVILILLGLFALLIPLIPGSLMIFIGLEFVGVEILFGEKISAAIRKCRDKIKIFFNF